jgi:hypothetical protein
LCGTTANPISITALVNYVHDFSGSSVNGTIT